MSHTIRNERTKGFLDQLARRRRTQKMVRDVQNDEWLFELDEVIDAQDYE